MSQYINYGIDLGTTNSCIAKWENDDVRVFQNNDQMNVTPSAVHITKNGRVIVGRRALNALANDSDNVAVEFKRLMGQRYSKDFPSSKRNLTSEELSAEVLKSLIENAIRQTDDSIKAAVITVPAAFGTLQCEATRNAANMVGLTESPLIQEPIAAAIAYGLTIGAKDQRWLVFDLGGGTLDIAIISTRDGRLTVIEHRGDNFQGGKDIDRLIVEKCLIPALQNEYALPDQTENTDEYQQLYRRLAIIAEQTKIDLSGLSRVEVNISDIGDDQSGEPIETEISITRSDIEEIVKPLLNNYINLAKEVITGARITNNDLDRIILVGGPTQMPIIRKTLEEQLGTKVDYSLDPMTVVARGAAIYASMLESTTLSSSIDTPNEETQSKTTQAIDCAKIAVDLAFDPVSSSLTTPVDGKIHSEKVKEVKFDTEDGHWSSGWIPVNDSFFEATVSLLDGKMTRFWIYARDEQGRLLETDPGEIRIRGGGLVVSAPPLPHTISVEVQRADGQSELSPVFTRGTSLPSEKTVTFRANQTLRPSEQGEKLSIKIWEGEELNDPSCNMWLTNLNIYAENIRRPIPKDTEIEITIKIDNSRLMTVEAFVPHLNQHFDNDVYIPEEAIREPEEILNEIPEHIEHCLERIDIVESQLVGTENESIRKQVEQLRRKTEDIDLRASELSDTTHAETADQVSQLDRDTRNIRAELSKIEQSVGSTNKLVRADEAAETIDSISRLAEDFGTDKEKREIEMLRRETERAIEKNDARLIEKIIDAGEYLRGQILTRQPWFWQKWFEKLKQPENNFTNMNAAANLINKGELAIKKGDSDGLKDVVRQLWKLENVDQVEADRESALQSGLRKY